MKIHCCHCQKKVTASLLAGGALLPNGRTLPVSSKHWVCPNCHNHVACKKGSEQPFGTIQTTEIKSVTYSIAILIDAMKSNGIKYGHISGQMTKRLGHQYRQQSVKSLQEPLVARVAIVKYLHEASQSKQAQVRALLNKKLHDISFLDVLRPKIKIYCCQSASIKLATLFLAKEMAAKPNGSKPNSVYWVCECCGNHVGCSEQSSGIIKPLGVIATPEIRLARIHIHNKLDAIWKLGYRSRTEVYEYLSDALGIHEYHTANITSIEQARATYRALNNLTKTLTTKQQIRINELIDKVA